MELLNEIIKQTVPDDDIQKEIDSILKRINKSISVNKIKAKAMSGGSVAKGTFLSGDYDIDIFVKFDYSYKDDDISKLLGQVLKGFKAVKVHGSRDYFQIKNKLKYEIVPVLDIKDPKKALNVTDMSPLHVDWVKKYSKFANEIRLSKLFCKAQHCYGAESYIRGFSGHVLDILTIYYKGFINLLKASNKWKEFGVVDFENYYNGKAFDEINKSKISPLIVIDPILPARNAAAALSKEKFDIFRKAAKDFLKKPSKEFFVKKEFTVDSLEKKVRKNKLILIESSALKGKQDIVGSKFMKAFEFLKSQLVTNDFKLIDSGWKWDKKAIFYFILDPKPLSKITEREGPPILNKDRVKSFKDKHKKTFTKNKRIFAKVERQYTVVEDLISDLIKDDYVKERVKTIKQLQ
jgi:tRNA nucleotidyltransferase (CCA-adding enzyme)